MSDLINPPHYKQGQVECVEALESCLTNLSGIEAYCTGNALKYLWRWKDKGGKTDLLKARWYLDRLLGVREEPPSVAANRESKLRSYNQIAGEALCGVSLTALNAAYDRLTYLDAGLVSESRLAIGKLLDARKEIEHGLTPATAGDGDG